MHGSMRGRGTRRAAAAVALVGTSWIGVAACSAAGTTASEAAWLAAAGVPAIESTLRLVPDGLPRLWLVDAGADVGAVVPWPVEGTSAMVLAGRSFAPRGIESEGDGAFVQVWTLAGDAVPAWWGEWTAERAGGGGGERLTIQGHDVLHVGGSPRRPPEEWFAIVGGRHLVRATRRVLLEQSLRAHGSPLAVRWRALAAPALPAGPYSMLLAAAPDATSAAVVPWPAAQAAFALGVRAGDDALAFAALTTDAAATAEWLRSSGFEPHDVAVDAAAGVLRATPRLRDDAWPLLAFARLLGLWLLV